MRHQSLELFVRYLLPDVAEEATGSPKFLGNLRCPFAMFQSDSGGTACVRPLRQSNVAPGMQKAEAPMTSLSELNSMAFGFAVYASQCGLLQPHARLASSCWSGSTGRDSHPQGSDERFQSCKATSHSPFPSLLGAITSPSELSLAAKLTAGKATSDDSCTRSVDSYRRHERNSLRQVTDPPSAMNKADERD